MSGSERWLRLPPFFAKSTIALMDSLEGSRSLRGTEAAREAAESLGQAIAGEARPGAE